MKALVFSLKISIFALILFGGILLMPQKTQARSLAWYENLISDGDFTSAGSLSLTQIQNFLSSRGSYLAGYNWGGKSAARWIYDESRDHGINPQVILVTLQKEQSLITSGSPSQTRLDWAMGYACYDTGAWNENYKGFGNQIAGAAYMMRNNFNLGRGPGSSHVGDTISLRYKSWEAPLVAIYLSNSATAVLYRYTPYVCNGNYNFYTIGRSWFNWQNYVPVLYRAVGDPKIYLIDGGRKKWFPTEEIFYGWGFRFGQEFEVSANDLNNIPTSVNITRLTKDSRGVTYFIDKGVRKAVPNYTIFTAFGFSFDDVIRISDTVLNYFGDTGVLRRVVQNTNGNYYLIEQGKAYQVKNTISYYAWSFNQSSRTPLRDINYFFNPNNNHPYGYLNYLAKDSKADIYLLSYKKKYKFSDPAVLSHWGYTASNAVLAPEAILNYRATAGNMTRLFRAGGSNKIWLMINGRRRWVVHPQTLTRLKYSWSDIRVLSPYIAKTLRIGPLIVK